MLLISWNRKIRNFLLNLYKLRIIWNKFKVFILVSCKKLAFGSRNWRKKIKIVDRLRITIVLYMLSLAKWRLSKYIARELNRSILLGSCSSSRQDCKICTKWWYTNAWTTSKNKWISLSNYAKNKAKQYKQYQPNRNTHKHTYKTKSWTIPPLSYNTPNTPISCNNHPFYPTHPQPTCQTYYTNIKIR